MKLFCNFLSALEIALTSSGIHVVMQEMTLFTGKMEQHDMDSIVQPTAGATYSREQLNDFLNEILEMAIVIYTDADQLQSWIGGRARQPCAQMKMNTAGNHIAQILRRMRYLKDIHKATNLDAMRKVACSDLFWGNLEYRKAAIRGALHAAVYVRENVLHLIMRICSQ